MDTTNIVTYGVIGCWSCCRCCCCYHAEAFCLFCLKLFVPEPRDIQQRLRSCGRFLLLLDFGPQSFELQVRMQCRAGSSICGSPVREIRNRESGLLLATVLLLSLMVLYYY